MVLTVDLGLCAALAAWVCVCVLIVWACFNVRLHLYGPSKARWWRGEAPPGCDWWTQEPKNNRAGNVKEA